MNGNRINFGAPGARPLPTACRTRSEAVQTQGDYFFAAARCFRARSRAQRLRAAVDIRARAVAVTLRPAFRMARVA